MDKVNKRKFLLIVLFLSILVVVFLLVGKITFAFLADEISGDVKQSSEITATGDTLLFVKGTPITLNASSDTFTSTGKSLSSTTKPSAKLVANSSSKTADATYAVGFKITGNTFSYTDSTKPELILTIKDESGNIITTSSDTLSYVTVTDRSGEEISGFDVTNALGNYNVVVEKAINTNSSTTGTTHVLTYTLTFVNYEFDQSVNEGSSVSLEAVIQKNKIDAVKLSDYVKMLHGGINGKSNIYLHDSTLENGAGDNSYRYSGSYESVNNYVCLNFDENGDCIWDYMYRIIGVFGDNVKLIKADYAKKLNGDESIGNYAGTYRELDSDDSLGISKGLNTKEEIATYYWNKKTRVTGSNNNLNDWAESELYSDNLYSYFFVSGAGISVDKLKDHEWVVGGNTSYKLLNDIPKNVYQNEIVTPETNKTFTAKIGLMYVSDYAFAADPDVWSINLADYGENVDKNWMYMGLSEWSITKASETTNRVFSIYDRPIATPVRLNFAVRPCFYLNDDVKKLSGEGSIDAPYIIE